MPGLKAVGLFGTRRLYRSMPRGLDGRILHEANSGLTGPFYRRLPAVLPPSVHHDSAEISDGEVPTWYDRRESDAIHTPLGGYQVKLRHNRNFLILWSGQLVSTFGDNIFTTGLLWYVLVLTHSSLDLTLASLAQSLPALIGLAAGVFVDRWRKRLTMIVSDALRALILVGLFAVSLAPRPSVDALLLLIAVLAGVGAFFRPAQLALLPRIVSKDQLTEASGVNQSGSYVARLAGTLSGGAILAFVGAPLVFLANALSFVGSIISLVFIRVTEERRPPAERHLWREWRAGFRVIHDSSLILRINASSIFANFALSALAIVITAWVRQRLHGNAFDLAVVNAAELVGVIMSGVTIKWVRTGLTLANILVLGDLVAALAIAGIAAVPTVMWTAVCLFAGAFSIGTVNVALTTLMLHTVPEDVRGRVFGAYGAMNRLSSPLGIAVFGLLLVVVPLPWLLPIMGVFPLAAGLVFHGRRTRAALDDHTTTWLAR